MKYYLLFIFLLVISVLFRFYDMVWGQPFFFHPDERNIAASVSQLSFPTNMNPHFFAYGSLPIYTIYFLGICSNVLHFSHIHLFTVSFEDAIIIGRLLSAVFSTLLMFLLYIVGTNLHSKKTGVMAAILGGTSIGLIQFAHFATFEMWLTFFSLLLTYVSFCYLSFPSKKYLFELSIILGILISIKISSLVLFLPIFLTIYFKIISNKKSLFYTSYTILSHFLFVFLCSALIYCITNPFVILDSNAFTESMKYETSVATGKFPVFYTEGFTNTFPFYYQLLHVYPFLLNNICTILFIFSFWYVLWKIYKQKAQKLFLFLVFFLALFISQAVLFVKWTRYVVPTLPYIYILIAYTATNLLDTTKRRHFPFMQNSIHAGVILTITLSLFYAVSFLYFAYMQTDSRIQASMWAKNHIQKNSQILSEVYDLGIVPFNDTFSNITLFNFYDLEINSDSSKKLHDTLQSSEYIILPSQRIMKNRVLYPSLFPKGNSFYTSLFDKKKYQQIYQTPCNVICKIVYGGDPVFDIEETATVFDRPTVYIFKKL